VGEPSLEQRVGQLERELAVLRARLDAADLRPAPAAPAQAAPIAPTPMLGTGGPPTPPVTLREFPRPIEPLEQIEPSGPVPAAEPESPPLAPAPKIAALQELRSRYGAYELHPRRDEPTLERRIGGQVFAVAGALIVIVGLALAVKVAIDYGWFRLLPPGLRCLGIAGVGAAFLVVGELLRARVRPIAVAGCNAAGVGGLYVAAYAAYGVFHLVAAPLAFALMAGAAGAGLVVALRHGFLSTAALSLIGAYLVPVLLAQPDASPYILPVYLLLLSAVALSLAAWRARPFGPVRDVAWLGAGLLGLLWTLSQADEIPGAVLGFWAIAWAMHQGELLVTAARGELWGLEAPAGSGRDALPSRPEHRRGERRAWRRRVEPLLLAVATTAGVVAIGALVLEHETSLEHWLAPASLFVVTSMLAVVFGGHLRVLRDRPRTDLETLAAAHAAQAGALLVVAVALALGGWVEVTAWLAMGVGAALAGRWTGARSLEVYGWLLLTIASARLVIYDMSFGPASVPWSIAGGVAIAPWTVLVAGAGVAWMLVAALMLSVVRDEDGRVVIGPRARGAFVAAALAAGAWMLAPAHPQTSATSLCLVWLGLSLAYRAPARVQPRLHMDALGSLAAAASIFPWIVASEPGEWLVDTAAPGMHPAFWLAGAVVLVLGAHAWASRRWTSRTEMGSPWPVIASLAALVAFSASSIEVARSAALLADDVTARRAAVSLWWGLWGVGLVVAGFWMRTGPLRYVGLGLIAIGAVKAVVLDLAGVPPLWRVASFVGLGGLMLGIAVLYGRVSASLEGERSRPEGPAPRGLG